MIAVPYSRRASLRVVATQALLVGVSIAAGLALWLDHNSADVVQDAPTAADTGATDPQPAEARRTSPVVPMIAEQKQFFASSGDESSDAAAPLQQALRFPASSRPTFDVVAVQAAQDEVTRQLVLPAFPQGVASEPAGDLQIENHAKSTASRAPTSIHSPPASSLPTLSMPPAVAANAIAAAPPTAAPSAVEMSPPRAMQPEPPTPAEAGSAAMAASDPWADLMPAPAPAEAATLSIDDARLMALRNNKDIAVLGYAPQITAAQTATEDAIFDPVFNINTQGGHYFRQTSTLVNSLGVGIPTLNTTFWQPIAGLNQAYFEKLFVTGGRAQIGIGQNLTGYSPAGDFVNVNPAWQSTINLILEQPLFRGRGPAATQALLRIARANESQSWHAFQTLVNQVLRDAEFAYWETADAYRELQLRELALAQALRTLDREQERMRIGEGALPEVAQAAEHVEEYRIDRADAEKRYYAAQRELRRIMGVPPDDPRPIIPATEGSEAPLVVDWSAGTQQALGRPELGAQQAAVEAADVEYQRRLNGLRPDVAVRAIYSVSGLDNQLDGAWSAVGGWDYNDWTAGVIYRQPLGRRADHAYAQRAQAALCMETARLRRLEHEILHELGAALEDVQAAENMLVLQRRRREAAALQLDARRELYQEGRAALRDQIDAEERYTTAMIDEAAARIDYQRALTRWNFARGAMNDSTLLVGP